MDVLLADDCICFWNVWEEAGKGSSGRPPPRFTEPQPCPGLLSHVHGAAEAEGRTERNRRENRSGKGFSAEGTEPELWRGQVREELRLQASTSLALGSRPSAREGQTEQRGWGTDAFTGLSSTVRMLPTPATCFFCPLAFPAALGGLRSHGVPLGLGYGRALLGHGLSPVTARTPQHSQLAASLSSSR